MSIQWCFDNLKRDSFTNRNHPPDHPLWQTLKRTILENIRTHGAVKIYEEMRHTRWEDSCGQSPFDETFAACFNIVNGARPRADDTGAGAVIMRQILEELAGDSALANCTHNLTAAE